MEGSIEIREITTKKGLKEFIKFADDLYAGCPYYVPTLHSDELAGLDWEQNPAYEYAEARYFMAYKNGTPAGRVGVILNKQANERHNRRRVRLTRLDFIDDLEVSGALLAKAETVAAELGMDTVFGPLGFCDMDKEGMLVEGFQELNTFITYYNYEYYPRHMEAHGYSGEKDWIEYQVFAEGVDADRLERIARRALERYKLHLAVIKNRKELKPYIYRIFDLINETYEKLYSAVLVSQKQIDYYVGQFVGFINTDYLCVVENEQNEIVGFALAMPSLAKAMRQAKGEIFPFGWIPLLKALYGRNDCLEMYFLVVTEVYKNKGLPAIMLGHVTANAIKNGIVYAETGPELADNTAIHSVWGSFKTRRHKRRRSYIKTLD